MNRKWKLLYIRKCEEEKKQQKVAFSFKATNFIKCYKLELSIVLEFFSKNSNGFIRILIFIAKQLETY